MGECDDSDKKKKMSDVSIKEARQIIIRKSLSGMVGKM